MYYNTGPILRPEISYNFTENTCILIQQTQHVKNIFCDLIVTIIVQQYFSNYLDNYNLFTWNNNFDLILKFRIQVHVFYFISIVYMFFILWRLKY